MVKGSWFVPKVTCSAADEGTSAFQIGIDGLTNFNSFIRNGIETVSDCSQVTGNPLYGVDFFLASKPVTSTCIKTVSGGDKVEGIVKYSSGLFYLTFKDLTKGWSCTIKGSDSGATRSTAEWVACCGTNIVNFGPLADFGTIKSGLKYTGVSGTDYATIGSHSGSIGSFASISSKITVWHVNMNDASHNNMAYPSALYDSGTSFTVTWVLGT